MKIKRLLVPILALSFIANLILAFSLIHILSLRNLDVLSDNNSLQPINDEGALISDIKNGTEANDTDNDISHEEIVGKTPKPHMKEDYELYNTINYDQLFCGTWKVIDLIPSDFPMPSSYSGFDEDGNFRGPDWTTILGIEITFKVGYKENYIEYGGERYDLAYGFKTYSHSLFSEDDRIGYNYARSFGITGNYYSIVYFVHPDNIRVKGSDPDRANEVFISDLCYLYLKDNDTIYASDGVLTYLLERITS